MSWSDGYGRPGERCFNFDRALRESVAMVLRAASVRLQRAVDEELLEEGFSWVEYATLVVVAKVPGLSQQGLSERTGADRTRISEALAELEERGLVERGPHSTDRRKRSARPTPSTAGAVEAGARALGRAERSCLKALSPRERERVRSLLDRTLPQPPRIWDLFL